MNLLVEIAADEGALVVSADAEAPGHAVKVAAIIDDPRGRLEALLHHPKEGVLLDVWKLESVSDLMGLIVIVI